MLICQFRPGAGISLSPIFYFIVSAFLHCSSTRQFHTHSTKNTSAQRDEGNCIISWSQESFSPCRVSPMFKQLCQKTRSLCVCVSHAASHFHCLLPQTLERGGLQFFHQGFDPTCSIDQFCRGNDVLGASIFHLGQKPQCSYFCIGHPSQEEHQSDSVLTMLTCIFKEINRLS